MLALGGSLARLELGQAGQAGLRLAAHDAAAEVALDLCKHVSMGRQIKAKKMKRKVERKERSCTARKGE